MAHWCLNIFKIQLLVNYKYAIFWKGLLINIFNKFYSQSIYPTIVLFTCLYVINYSQSPNRYTQNVICLIYINTNCLLGILARQMTQNCYYSIYTLLFASKCIYVFIWFLFTVWSKGTPHFTHLLYIFLSYNVTWYSSACLNSCLRKI